MVDIVEYQRVVNKAGMFLYRNGEQAFAEELRTATVGFIKPLMEMLNINTKAELARNKSKPLKVVKVFSRENRAKPAENLE